LVFGPQQPLFYIEIAYNPGRTLFGPNILAKGEIANGAGDLIKDVHFICPDLCLSSEEEWRFDIYPNPAKDIIHLRWSTPGSTATKAQIFDPIGRLIETFELWGNAADVGTTDLNCDDLLPGTYFVRITDGQGHSLMISKVIFL
jgi:hypothetical protein